MYMCMMHIRNVVCITKVVYIKGVLIVQTFEFSLNSFSEPSSHSPPKDLQNTIYKDQFRWQTLPVCDIELDFWTMMSFQYERNKGVPSNQPTNCPVR